LGRRGKPVWGRAASLTQPSCNSLNFYINISLWQRIGADLNSRRANALSFIAYLPVRASAAALGDLYASIIAFPGTFRTNASPAAAYSVPLAAAAWGRYYALTIAVRGTAGADALAAAAYPSIGTSAAGVGQFRACAVAFLCTVLIDGFVNPPQVCRCRQAPLYPSREDLSLCRAVRPVL
jgi:hypothetical protein